MDILITAYKYDGNGWFDGTTCWQFSEVDNAYLEVPNSTSVAPELSVGTWPKWDATQKAWVSTPTPATPEELVGVKVALFPTSTYEQFLQAQVESFANDDGFTLTRDEAQGVCWLEVFTSPVQDIEEVRKAKLEAIKQGLEEYRKSATLQSSLGFVVDATERSLVDVQGLIVLNPPEGHVIFRDANNAFHQITVEDLHTLQKEIYAKGLEGYSIKWKLDKAVTDAKTVEEIEAVEVVYV